MCISGGLTVGDVTYGNGPADVARREPAKPRLGAPVGPLFLGPQPSKCGRPHRAGVVEVEGQIFRHTARAGVWGAGCVILIIVDLIVVIVGAAVGRTEGVGGGGEGRGGGLFPGAVGFAVGLVQVTKRAG